MATKKQNVPATKKLPAATNSKPTPTDTFEDAGDTFIIEMNPPKRIRGVNPEAAKILEKVEKTVVNVQIGQAFLIPKVYEHTIKRYLRQEHKQFNFLYSAVDNNDAAVRVYKSTPDSKTSKSKNK